MELLPDVRRFQGWFCKASQKVTENAHDIRAIYWLLYSRLCACVKEQIVH